MAAGLSNVQLGVQSQPNPLATSTTTLGGVQTGNASDKKNVKDEVMPDQLNTMVNELRYAAVVSCLRRRLIMREYIKKQKTLKDEIERHSIKSFKKVNTETNKLRKDVSLVSSGIQKDASAVENLKLELSQELINAEIARQTSNTPLAFQHENMAPREYFQKLVESFEERMHLYRRQVEEVESHLASLHQPQTVSPQEISDVMKKLHETFITLAARMHEIHEFAKLEKERYLDYREKAFGDRTNIFQRKTVGEQRLYYDMPGTTIGPSPITSRKNTTNSYINPSATSQGVRSLGMVNPLSTVNSFTSGLGSSFAAIKPSTLTGTTGFGQTTGTGLLSSSLGFGANQFGTSNTLGLSSSALGKSIGSSGFGGLGTSSTLTGTGTSLQLQNPPAGNNKLQKRR